MACFHSAAWLFGNHTAEFKTSVFLIRTEHFAYRKIEKSIGVRRTKIVFIYKNAIVRHIGMTVYEIFDVFCFSKACNSIVFIGFAVKHYFGLQELE